jgi:hypothetical protein
MVRLSTVTIQVTHSWLALLVCSMADITTLACLHVLIVEIRVRLSVEMSPSVKNKSDVRGFIP